MTVKEVGLNFEIKEGKKAEMNNPHVTDKLTLG
jgi:hypothetical protein